MTEDWELALKKYIETTKGVDVSSLYVMGDYEKRSYGRCETCHYTEIKVKYTLRWQTTDCHWDSEEFEDMADLLKVAVEYGK